MSEPLEPTQEVTEGAVSDSETEEVIEIQPKARKASTVDAPTCVRAEAGDSYISLAKRYFPDRAVSVVSAELFRINRQRQIREGVRIILKEKN